MELSERQTTTEAKETPESKGSAPTEFLTNLLKSCKKEESESNPETFRLLNDNTTLFIQESKSETFWVDYDLVWGILKSKYNIEYTEVRKLISSTVEEVLGFKPYTPNSLKYSSRGTVEKVLGFKPYTPENFGIVQIYEVEEVLGFKPYTPF